ncbi:cytochrome c oxidase assembly protein [Aurantimonas marina]|uniref:cytochrome c oxidase assembly protein n=1 Tax=Aurantimonas marina TaxID=2780508 RepID=UPI002FCD8E06
MTPEISGPILLILAVYARGAFRRRSVRRPVSVIRHVLFMMGMLTLFLSLQSPIDPMGERLFLAHQIQHLILRMIGPMLVVLARPQGAPVAGLPKRVRRRVAAPLMKSGALSSAYNLLTRPLVSFVLFVLSLYVWQIPPVHNAALLNSLIHWAMHLTMLATGLLFFAMVFGRRDVPSAPSAHSATLRDDRNEHPSGCDHSLQDHRSLHRLRHRGAALRHRAAHRRDRG